MPPWFWDIADPVLLVISPLVALVGAIWNRPIWALSGSLFSIPFSGALIGANKWDFRLIGLVMLLSPVGLAIAIQRRLIWVACAAFVLFAGAIGWVAIVRSLNH